jgi:hypothetical protein
MTSLAAHAVPAWLKKAKLGIQILEPVRGARVPQRVVLSARVLQQLVLDLFTKSGNTYTTNAAMNSYPALAKSYGLPVPSGQCK